MTTRQSTASQRINRIEVQRVKDVSTDITPRTPGELRRWLALVLRIEVPREPLVAGSVAPFEYLCWSFFEGGARDGAPQAGEPRDAVVWAARGSGKTFYAAIATALDLIFKPGVQVKILGGSRDQAGRMHEHLRRLFEAPALAGLVDGKIGERKGRLRNGSGVEVLAQSHRSVRGTRPHKLRCDEVDLFDPEVWRAAQLVTRSGWCGTGAQRVFVRGSIEALSTLHVAGGLMAKVVDEATRGESSRRVFRWTAIDVLEVCPPSRRCAGCGLEEDCAGRAKPAHNRGGHLRIDDALAMRARSDTELWQAEMLCRRPLVRDAVYPEFDPQTHVIADEQAPAEGTIVCGMDFGVREAAVLWAHVSGDGVLRVLDERVVRGAVIDDHARAIVQGAPGLARGPGDTASNEEAEAARRWPVPAWVGADPAGLARSEMTGFGPVHALRRAGLAVRCKRLGVTEGIRLVRARVAPASGPPTLLVHARCGRLIEALHGYRWDSRAGAEGGPGGEAAPVKDGLDHVADALRYLVVNLDAPARAQVQAY